MKFTFKEFIDQFATDRDCLVDIIHLKYPKWQCWDCGCQKYYLLHKRPVMMCKKCKRHHYPLKGTIFYKSRTPLTIWYYVIFLMTKTRSGISAKEVQRQTGVTYKTAWRMLNKIRTVMKVADGKLSGTVEIDETYVGGKAKNRAGKFYFTDQYDPKTIVLGMLERGGRVKTTIIPNTGNLTMLNSIKKFIDPSTKIYTDEFSSYKTIKKHGFKHQYVNHMENYVNQKNKRIYTQTIENFWSQVKRGIYGTYRKVSDKYLQQYLNEFGFRYTHRHDDLFYLLMNRAVRVG